MRARAIALALVCAVAHAPQAVAQPGTLLPVPASRTGRAGTLTLDSGTVVRIAGVRDVRLERAVERFTIRLERRIGASLRRATFAPAAPAAGAIEIHVEGAGMAVQGVEEEERYRLQVSSAGARLSAPTVVGALRGMETILQLVEEARGGARLPALDIADAPRFPWRGLLVDVARHFMSVEQMKRTLDGMAMVKLNVLHWHLSDDQGFRVESRRFPRLHELGSDGQFYTQEEIRELVAYARDRGIRVVPEFDMPGHSTSFFVGYPEFGTRNPPVALRRDWGGSDAIFDPSREETYTFIDQFIGEMVTLFPDAWWHVGGDEVEPGHWRRNAAIERWRVARGLADKGAIQAYFNGRLHAILERHERRMIGWDEVVHPQLPRDVLVHSWRGTEQLAGAVRRGYASILSAPWYLDHMKSAAEYYAADPVPASSTLTEAQRRRVLGGEACMWSEYITEASADSRLWPRLGAVAERLWSPQAVTDVADLYRRLPILAARLEEFGIRASTHTARTLRARAPGVDVAPVESLLTVLHPPQFGQRIDGRRTTQRDPLDRLVDAAIPDPPGRWATERLVRQVVANRGDPAARDSLGALFGRWKRLLPAVRTVAADSPYLAEAVPAATALARVATIGEEALARLRSGTPIPASWRTARGAELRRLAVVHGTLRVAVADAVSRLVAGVR